MKNPFLIFCLITLTCSAQDDYVQNGLRFEDYVYKKNFKTVLMHRSDNPLTYPAIKHLTDETLELSFDDLDGAPKDLYYEIILCQYDWTPCDLLPSQYIEGSPENLLNTYEYSACQYSKYIHYKLQIPNEYVQLKKSGNYLLKVYENGDKQDLVLTKRFVVYEPIFNITSSILRSNDPEQKYSAQMLSFTVQSEVIPINNPYQNLHVSVLQNFDWTNMIEGYTPTFVKGQELEYSNQDKNLIPGGQEYRNLDLKSTTYKSLNIQSITLANPIKVNLSTDQRRSHKSYESWTDLDGKKRIYNDRAFNHNTESEYMETQFSLFMPPSNNPVYIHGSICDYALQNECKMRYNHDIKAYETSVLVKQGMHNYAYTTYNAEKKNMSLSEIEGDHWETENDYVIMVYYRSFTDRNDRLMGYQVVNTRR